MKEGVLANGVVTIITLSFKSIINTSDTKAALTTCRIWNSSALTVMLHTI
jgi:hypothetical protein